MISCVARNAGTYFLPLTLVGKVDEFVALNVSAQEAKAQWQGEQYVPHLTN